MKRKLTMLSAAVVVALGLLLGASTAQATDVIFNDDGNAIRIEDLEVVDENTEVIGVYDVEFVNNRGIDVYGSGFDFPDDETIFLAREAVNNALNTENAGPVGEVGDDQFFIGNKWEDGRLVALGSELISEDWETCETGCIAVFGLGGVAVLDPNAVFVYADFTVVEGPEPPPEGDPVTIGGTVTGLTGSGLVLQNNGTDDLLITGDGPFTFATPLRPGGLYSVTVFSNPKNPSQTCSVTNGNGTVPTENVTNITVACTEGPVSDISKVAAEDDTLPDGTILSEILREGGVAINSLGKVAFHGQTGTTPAVFTQDRLVARKGETLPGTDDFVSRIYDNGGVAINLLGEVAFHGRQLSRYEAVFTDQFGVVAQEESSLQGEPLIIPEEISDSGKVAINLFGQVAFHGKIEVGSGLFDKETLQAVFTDDRLAAVQGSKLEDNTTIVEEINDSGGVAINDLGTVVYHGEVIDPDVGGDTLAAVLTNQPLTAQQGLVAKEGSILGEDIVGEINKDAGVAINLSGDVAFQARVFDPVLGIDTVLAVFTQEGVVVKEGDTLPDGTTVDEISDIGGVAINEFGEVAFHGRVVDPATGIDTVAAVFTQYRVVAKEDDNLADGTTTLDEIDDTGGVAINAFGEVAFHGKSNGSEAVFMSGVSLPPSDSPEAGLFRSITW